MIIFIAADCTAGFLWRLRLWSNRWLHAHGKGYLLQIQFHAADNIPCYVLENITMILGKGRYWNPDNLNPILANQGYIYDNRCRS